MTTPHQSLMTAHEAISLLARMVAELQTDLADARLRIYQLEHPHRLKRTPPVAPPGQPE